MPLLDKAKDQLPTPSAPAKAPTKAPPSTSRPSADEPVEPPPKQGSTSAKEKRPSTVS